MGADRKTMVPGNMCLKGTNIKHPQNVNFSTKIYLSLQPMIPRCSEKFRKRQYSLRSHFGI